MAQDHADLADSDHDGLSDKLEQALLVQFVPAFRIGIHDCSNYPAEFRANSVSPVVKAENGTIYGQVFPAKGSTFHGPAAVEIHYYHLWQSDCGAHGHPLDTEHVSTLVQKTADETWRALYWYAAAHENTVCDVSQISRASTLNAAGKGPTVWISPAKHASYLNGVLCQRGCGSDRCGEMTALLAGKLINLGEPGFPMNSSRFIASTDWPLKAKMAASDFSSPVLARLDQTAATDIAWVNAGRHPAQGVIAISNTTYTAIEGGGQSARSAISEAADSAGGALRTGFRSTVRAFKSSAKHVKKAVGVCE